MTWEQEDEFKRGIEFFIKRETIILGSDTKDKLYKLVQKYFCIEFEENLKHKMTTPRAFKVALNTINSMTEPYGLESELTSDFNFHQVHLEAVSKMLVDSIL